MLAFTIGIPFPDKGREAAGQGAGFGDEPKKKNTNWKLGQEKHLTEKMKKDLRKVNFLIYTLRRLPVMTMYNLAQKKLSARYMYNLGSTSTLAVAVLSFPRPWSPTTPFDVFSGSATLTPTGSRLPLAQGNSIVMFKVPADRSPLTR